MLSVQLVLREGTDRLVESPRMKRSLEAVFGNILPKGAAPFIYLRSVHA